MKWVIYCVAVMLGLMLGRALLSNSHEVEEKAPLSQRSPTNKRSASRAIPSRISWLLQDESSSLNTHVSYKDSVRILHEKKRSPIRTRTFLGHRIHLVSREQLIQALSNGEIRTPNELAEAARRLVREDREGTFDLIEQGEIYYGGMDNLYAFTNAAYWTWVKIDAPSLVERVKKLKRGGSQQDRSLRISSYWAQQYPEEAVKRYDELVRLRNMKDMGSVDLTNDAYANQIVRSWIKKDKEGMKSYILNLPLGRKRRALGIFLSISLSD